MAEINITEGMAGHQTTIALGLPALQMPALAVQDVTFTTVTPSAPFTSETRCIWVIADADCQFMIGPSDANLDPKTNPATKIRANVAQAFGVYPGHVMYIYDGIS